MTRYAIHYMGDPDTNPWGWLSWAGFVGKSKDVVGPGRLWDPARYPTDLRHQMLGAWVRALDPETPDPDIHGRVFRSPEGDDRWWRIVQENKSQKG